MEILPINRDLPPLNSNKMLLPLELYDDWGTKFCHMITMIDTLAPWYLGLKFYKNSSSFVSISFNMLFVRMAAISVEKLEIWKTHKYSKTWITLNSLHFSYNLNYDQNFCLLMFLVIYMYIPFRFFLYGITFWCPLVHKN